jgi:uncharacterized membrane protein
MRTVLRLLLLVAAVLALLVAAAMVPTAFFNWCPEPNESFRCMPGGYEEAAVARAWLVGSLAIAAVAVWVAARLGRRSEP